MSDSSVVLIPAGVLFLLVLAIILVSSTRRGSANKGKNKDKNSVPDDPDHAISWLEQLADQESDEQEQ